MKTKLSQMIFTLVFLVVLMSSCSTIPSEITQTTSTPPEPTITPSPSINPPLKVFELFPDISIDYFDEFQAIYKSTGWGFDAGTIRNGVLVVEGKNWNGLSRQNKIVEGMGVSIDFSYSSDSNFNIYFDYGNWDTDSYKRFGIGIYGDNYLATDQWVGSDWIGDKALSGNLSLKPDTTYSILLAPFANGEFYVIVWDKLKPSNSVTYREYIGEDWSDLDWTFAIGADQGTINFDNYYEFNFDISKIPTITPTPVPQPTPTIIGGYPNQYLSVSGSSLQLRGAGGESIQTFFTFPEDIYEYYNKVKWSPSGKYVAVDYLTDSGHLHIFDSLGNEIIYIHTGIKFYGGSVSATNWDPTGRYLIFSSNGENNYTDLYLFDTVYETVTQLTDSYAKDSAGVFSPDGQKIVWKIDDSLFMMDLNGENKRSLGINLGGFWDWSPDGSSFLYGENHDLYLLDIASNQKTRLSFNGMLAIEGDAKFSSEGRIITYTEYGYDDSGNRFPELGNYLYSIDVEDPRQRTFLGNLYGIGYSYTPDKNIILGYGWLPSESHVMQPHIIAIKPDGTNISQISRYGAHGLLRGQWQPGSEVNQPFNPLDYLAPTPIPNWTPVADMPIYDGFEESLLNTDLWAVQSGFEFEGFRYVILDEALNIRSTEKIKQGGMDVHSTNEIPTKSLTAYEVRVKTYSGSYGDSFAGIRLETDLYNRPWWVECKLGNNWEEPTFYCQVAQINQDQQIIEYAISERPVELNTWYEIRIDISPEYGALQFSLNGEVLGTYLPDSASLLLASAKLRPVIGVWCTDGSINASFDDVRMGY